MRLECNFAKRTEYSIRVSLSLILALERHKKAMSPGPFFTLTVTTTAVVTAFTIHQLFQLCHISDKILLYNAQSSSCCIHPSRPPFNFLLFDFHVYLSER